MYKGGMTYLATLKDIAKEVGVSIATVSKALNNRPGVNLELQRKIIETAKKMNYAKLLPKIETKRSTHIVGVIVSDISNPFFANIVLSMEKVLYSQGYKYILSNTDENPEKELSYLRALTNHGVDGLIVAPSRSLKVNNELLNFYKKYNSLGGHIVFVDRVIEDLREDINYVIIDNFGAALEAVAYLKNKGHTQIGAITGPKEIFTSRERLKGFLKGMEVCGLEVKDKWIVDGKYTSEGAFKAALKLFENSDAPTALISFNNVMTLGILRAFKKLKLRIPEDVSLISFDDSPWNELNEVPITSIVQPVEEVGTVAATILIGGLKNFVSRKKVKPSKVILKAQILERESVKKI